jgi:hypothetical protein
MVESKSGYFTNDFKAHSEKSAEFGPKDINWLADGFRMDAASQVLTARPSNP